MPRAIADEAAAYELLEQLRWGGPPTSCPHCGVSGRCYFLHPACGPGRRTRTGTVSGRRVWKCAACRRQFSVLVATILQGTRISLCTWIAVIAEREQANRPLVAAELANRYGLSAETAHRMVRRLELAVGAVEADPEGRGRMLSAPGDPTAEPG